MTLLAEAGAAASRLAGSTTLRIGVTGLSRAGKTAFLTSLAAELLTRAAPRFALAPLGAGDVPRFDHPAHLAALAADPPAWPARTDAVSILALAASVPRSFLPPLRLRLEFLDYPGEWLLDLAMLGRSFRAWSEEALGRLAGAPEAELFRAFSESLPARAPADETLARSGARLHREALLRLRDRGYAHLQPGRQVMPAPGPQPPWLEFFPHTRDDALGGLLARRFDAYCEAVRRDMSSPLFASVDRLIVLADILTALGGGERAFADMRAALGDAARALRWEVGWLETAAALFALKLPPLGIKRVAYAATKADHVAERQRGNLRALMRALADAPARGARVEAFAIASVRCTEDFVWTLDGRPVSAVRGRVLGERVLTRSYPGEVPSDPPGPEFWEHPFLALPQFEPMRLPDGARGAVPNIGLGGLMEFLLGDVL